MIQTKRCPKCGETKAVDEFYRDRSRGDVRRYTCRACDNAYDKARFQTEKSKEKRKAYRKAYDQTEKRKAYQKAYNQSEVTNMTDRYIGGLLRAPLSKIPPEIIALKRAEIQLKRQLKEMK